VEALRQHLLAHANVEAHIEELPPHRPPPPLPPRRTYPVYYTYRPGLVGLNLDHTPRPTLVDYFTRLLGWIFRTPKGGQS
jgi:hypothetical protein